MSVLDLQASKTCRLVCEAHPGFRQLGSAFIVQFKNASWLLTNSHVANHEQRASERTFYYVPNGQQTAFPAKLVRDDNFCDLAVFSVETDLEIDDTIHNNPNVGDIVLTIGFPDSLSTTAHARTATGVVLKTMFGVTNGDTFSVTEDKRAYPCFLASGLDPAKGSSGSPVLLHNGEIVGYSKGFDDDGNALCFSGQNIVETLKQLCSRT